MYTVTIFKQSNLNRHVLLPPWPSRPGGNRGNRAAKSTYNGEPVVF